MPQKVLKFTGINRKVNEFQNTGACEELINLRPTASTLEVVKPKKEKFANVDYDVYNHTFGDKSLFIGVRYAQDFYVYLVDEEDGSISLIDSITGYGPDYSIAFLGNQMLLFHNTELHAYAYQNGAYVKTDAAVPDDIDIRYSVSSGYGYSQEVSLTASDPTSNEFKNAVQEHWSAALGQNSRKDETFGPILVAFNFSLSDGTEFWTNKWIYVNPFLYLPTGENGKKMIYYESDGTKRFTFNSFGLTFTISQKTMSSYGVNNTVSKINIYAARPVFPYNIDTMTAVTDNVHDREIYATAVGMNETGVTKQLLYFQKSIPVSEIESGDVSFKLDFGESQAGEKVLEVDAGPVKRAGSVVSYNNRAHLYDSYATIYPQSVVCHLNAVATYYEREAYVHLDCNGETIVRQITALVPIASSSGTVYKISCCYPDARAKKILIATDSGYCTINLEQSSRYNFAWGETNYTTSYNSDDTITTSNVIHEANTINVSEPYNPFVFPVEYSYGFGGRILDVSTAYLPISSTQVGQYPLTVFTTSGIYALEQGGGSSLYGNITPLQPLVIDGKTAATPYGTFFISSNGLYLLSGRESVNVSYILNGERELNLRELDSYKRLCCNGDIYDFSKLLSGEDFEDFVSDAMLTYDQLHNELYISSNKSDVLYSYVFNLNNKSFHKVAKKYMQGQSGARYAIEVVGDDKSVVDLHIEEGHDAQPMLLQSRPMSLEVLYTHIQRLLLLVDTKLAGNQKLFISVFGSDNLYDWRCIISSQKQSTILRQIRTNRAAKSYKDYIVLINGIVDTDTDISELIADYTVVNRRLG